MGELFSEKEINKQRKKAFDENPSLNLVAPCKIGEGILRFSEEERNAYIDEFNQNKSSVCFFVPASGSGSRMFQFLYEFLESPTEENRGQVEKFINSISEFAFYRKLPQSIRRSIENQTYDFENIVSYLLEEQGLGFGSLPKGMIPFHRNEPFILNPFQGHILQGLKVRKDDANFHFTIQNNYKESISNGVENVKGLTGRSFEVTYSEQSIETNSIAFYEDGETVRDSENNIISRPSGHGALLDHLNGLNEDILFIKNIDNIQHFNHSKKAITTWKTLGGVLIAFRNECLRIFNNPTREALIDLNNRYEVYSDLEIEQAKTKEEIKKLLDRPTRICGMVKNEGQPGGGPFWVSEGGVPTKQIVEKAQISMNGEQYKLMLQSTYFNPVMIAASTHSLEGEKFNLFDFRDDSKYFIVHKKYQAKDIRYIEQPGLWNGSMAFWNTIFVEIPSSTFSPVKNVLDLLKDAHKE